MIPSLKLPNDISAEGLPRQLIISAAIQEDNMNILTSPSEAAHLRQDPDPLIRVNLWFPNFISCTHFFQRKYPSLWHYARSSISCLSQVANAGKGSRVCLRAHEHDQDFTLSEFGFDMVHGYGRRWNVHHQEGRYSIALLISSRQIIKNKYSISLNTHV